MATPQTVHSGPTMTLAEWGDLPEDEPGELIDNRLVAEEEVGALHDIVVAWLVHALIDWIVPRRGFVGTTDTRFAVSSTRGRKPDVYAYFPGRRPPAHGLVTSPPDIMIEVVSPHPGDARRDRLDKMVDYAAFGVRLYWIADPASRMLEIFELGADGRYARAVGAAESMVTGVPGCSDLSIDLDLLWAEVERLEAE